MQIAFAWRSATSSASGAIFRSDQVFRADTASMMRSGLHWMLAMMSGGWLLPPPKSLFDNSPLRELLEVQFDFAGVRRSIAAGHLDALAMSAAGYISARSVSFYEARTGHCRGPACGVPASRRSSSLDHLMASVAVPFLFPPVLMGEEYYGDGAMREANPFSAAIHLGADRLLVIGTRNESRAADAGAAAVSDIRPDLRLHARFVVQRWPVFGPRAADADQRDRCEGRADQRRRRAAASRSTCW